MGNRFSHFSRVASAGARRLAWLGRRPYTAERLLEELYEALYGSWQLDGSRAVIVLPPDLSGFEAWLRAQGRGERTIRERIAYLERLRRELGTRFTVDDLYRFLANSGAREHYLKAVRLLLKYQGRDDLLDRLRGGWTPSSNELKIETAIGLEEALGAIRIAAGENSDYALYLAAILVTGLRPHEVRALRWSRQVIPRVFRLEKRSRLKRAYHAFLSPNLYAILLGSKKDDRVVRYRRETEYHVLKRIKERYPGFRPYELRALNAALLFKAGIPEPLIKYMHGWAPESVLRRYYLDRQLGLEEMLEDLLQKHNAALESVDRRLTEILEQMGSRG